MSQHDIDAAKIAIENLSSEEEDDLFQWLAGRHYTPEEYLAKQRLSEAYDRAKASEDIEGMSKDLLWAIGQIHILKRALDHALDKT